VREEAGKEEERTYSFSRATAEPDMAPAMTTTQREVRMGISIGSKSRAVIDERLGGRPTVGLKTD
jgi:hypothetical protein